MNKPTRSDRQQRGAKPNMSFARTPDFSATTHPAVVATVAQACAEAGASQVLVLDHTLQRAELCPERTGIREACKNIPGVHVLALQDRKFFREIKIPQGKVLDRVEVMKEVLDDSVLINIPVAKSHSTTGVSLGMKGLMGLIWDRESFHSQFNINQALAAEPGDYNLPPNGAGRAVIELFHAAHYSRPAVVEPLKNPGSLAAGEACGSGVKFLHGGAAVEDGPGLGIA